ncbi:MAG: helix-turn-helix transcriptional regulator [Bdellovibrionota bacterium]
MSTNNELGSILEETVGPLTFAMFVRVARTTLEISQAEMARKLKIARGTLCDIEKGRQAVSPKFALKIARTAGLSEDLTLTVCLQDQLNRLKIKKRVVLVA